MQQLAGASAEGHVTPQGVAQALWHEDPLMPAAYMDELLSDLFEVTVGELNPSLVEGSYYKTPGLEGERVYLESVDDEVVSAEEAIIVARIRRRVLQRFCIKSEVETERQRLVKEAERAREKAAMDAGM